MVIESAADATQRPERLEGPERRKKRRRAVVLGLLAALIFIGAHDAVAAPAKQWSTRVALLAIDTYQATLSPLLPRAGVQCRFQPTCSHYGEAVLRQHGIYRGGVRAAWRILRCGPWTPRNTLDLPP